ncbi:peptidoglycan-binding protein LysM [Polaribacter vadi]|uniref:peptidoglycan-binding protein LysM n=1 Tax=Polaribacter TaxID=52959 RepID=UPI001C095B7A|nr:MULTISPECIES: peptidoglycan-binding protein LysM [Polaribacter]MBU3012093.1 peptidoglycan-binding protein LysM [Polaribacter vadi]MDO6741909.1 peptidoglycan-binding protein LysM [Polaribacter sp. 1_MG-2023]
MIKKFIFLVLVFTLFVNATSVNISSDKKTTVYTTFVTKETKILPVNMDYNIPYLQNNYVAFKEAVAFKESQGKYYVVNTLGYLGKYQFGRTTLQRFKIYDTEAFLKNPEQQEKAFLALCKVNKWILRKDIKSSVGKTINGIKITESGILAAAHLSGAGNVKKFLRSNGNIRFADAYGATIQSYLKKFSNYDVSNIEADRLAKV